MTGPSLLRQRAPAAPRLAARRVWHPVVSALRGLHSGQVGDSITWLTVGAASLGALLVLTLR